MAINVGPSVVNPTHVFSLSDGTSTLGFITCDGQGRRNILTGFRQAPMPRTAMKMSQGAAKYEDFELPFTSIIQEDFSSGMLAENFEEDRTMYRDGRFIDTLHGDIICGPKETQTTTSLTSSPGSFIFFEYKRTLYALINNDGGGAPLLYRNGYRGAASSNSADLTKLNTDQSLPAGTDLSDCIAVIVDGPGSEEEQPWRTISSNTTGVNSVITVSSAWKIAHTTETSWVVLGSDDWIAITSHGLAGRVTSIVVAKDYVLFAQGESINIRKMREYNNAGAWTRNWADDGTNKADLLLVIANDEGTLKVWKALVDDNEITSSDVQDWGTDHTFENPIVVGNSSSRINNMVPYGEPKIPYIMKEDSFGSIKNNIYAQVPIGEMEALRSEYNGTAAMNYGVYLYFNMSEKIERYFDRRLDDVGPDNGEGLPESRQGIIRKLLPYPGRYYALLYSEDGTSSILCFNNYGWHEVWRGVSVTDDGTGATGEAAPFAFDVTNLTGKRSSDLIVQVIPGTPVDRMWFDWDGKICRIPVTLRPRNVSDYEYRDLSQIETAWIYGNLKDVQKYWHSIKLHTENLSGSGDTSQTIKVEYRVDEDASWTTAGYVDASPIEEIKLSSSYNITGYRIKFRFTLHTANVNKTPRILAYVVKGVVRVDVKKGWSVTVLTYNETDLNGIADSQANITSQLDTWANSDVTPAPLTLRHNISYYDNKKVFIDPASLSFQWVKLEPTRGKSTREYNEIASFTLYEV